ncbi:uncharacterized protein LOC128277450 [Anopheles cruzii]|uniref:uncharacterized protein LOC128277450 n=1 Tax=Anopheles cruzii TaxID=68878 RepID=UPI0022EC1AAA|nr:uncharacterized protein LOC128277450 [Anopheles cruzii]
MKTSRGGQSLPRPNSVGHSRGSNSPKGGRRGGNNKAKSFFRDVPEKDRKKFPAQGSNATGFPSKQRGTPGVQKTTNFKRMPVDRSRRVNDSGSGNRSSNNPNRSKGQGIDKTFNTGKRNQSKNGPNPRPGSSTDRFATSKPRDADQLFTCKPEKLNYCLAPDRLEAQARAVKHFERQERDQAFQHRKEERTRLHKLMMKKTRKGQPVMQGRMEMLFEKVKKTVGVQ